MIPCANSLELREIRGEVRRAAESNWSLRQRFNIRCRLNPDVSVFESAAVLLCATLLLIGPVLAVCMGIVGLAELPRNWHQLKTPAAELGVVSVVALANCVVTAVAFFCFAGGPNKRLHQICLGYPHRDQTLRRYIRKRTLLALLVLPLVSLLQFFAVTNLFAVSDINWTSGISFVLLQTAFQLSLVLLIAGKWIPCVKQYCIWVPGLAAILIGGYSVAVLRNEGSQHFPMLATAGQICVTYFSPLTWLSNIWFCGDSHNFLSTSLTCVMLTCCFCMGVRGYVRVLSAELPDSLDPDFATKPPQEIDVSSPGRRDQQECRSTAESVLRGVDAFEKEAANSGPKASMLKFFDELYHPTGIVIESRIFRRLYVVGGSFGLLFLISIALLSIAACFHSSTDTDCLQTARFVNTAILLVPLVLSMGEFIKADRAALYPISNWSLRWRAFKRIGQFATWVLPFWVALNIAFCWFHQVDLLAKIGLVTEPLSVAAACILVVLAASSVATKPGSVIKLLLLGSFSVISTLFVIGAFLVVLPTNQIAAVVELLLGDSAEIAVRALHLKSILMLLFAAIWSTGWIAINDYYPFDIHSRGGFSADLTTTRTKQELEMARR